MGVNRAQIDNIFTYHTPIGDQAERYQAIREKAKELAYLMCAAMPDSREASLAITSLQQAIMWANASIAINETPEVLAERKVTFKNVLEAWNQ